MKPRPVFWPGAFVQLREYPVNSGCDALPGSLKQCCLRPLRELTVFLDLFMFAGDAFTVNAGFENEVERVRCEAEFPLRDRQPSLGSLHNRLAIEIAKFP
jgi:hypothetical protein